MRIPEPPCRGAHAFQDEGIEAVESADDAIGHRAALRRLRVRIREVVEIRGQGRFAMHGNGMHRLCMRDRRGKTKGSSMQHGSKCEQQSQIQALPQLIDSRARLPRNGPKTRPGACEGRKKRIVGLEK